MKLWPSRIREMIRRLENAKKHSMELHGDERAIEVLGILLHEGGVRLPRPTRRRLPRGKGSRPGPRR